MSAVPPKKRGRYLIVAIVAVVVIAIVAFFGLRPHYDVELATVSEPVAGEATPLTVKVSNAGSWSGMFEERVFVDGSELQTVRFRLPGGESASVDVPLPENLSSGDHVVEVGDNTLTVHVMRPAAFEVMDLYSSDSLVKSGATATVTASIANTGDVGGAYRAVVRVDGRKVAERGVFVGADDTQTANFSVKLTGNGRHRISVADQSVQVRSAQVVRLGNGQIIKWTTGRGLGQLVVKGASRDGVVVLTSSDSKRRPLISVYVRAGSTATVRGVPDNSYYVYCATGSSWAPSLKRFLSSQERVRFRSKMRFTTTSTQYTSWTIGLKTVKTGGEPVETVSEADFPAM